MRTLRRPMFRGGSTGTGITSGLAPRQGYAAAGSVEDVERRKKILRAGVGQTSDRSLSNFIGSYILGIFKILFDFSSFLTHIQRFWPSPGAKCTEFRSESDGIGPGTPKTEKKYETNVFPLTLLTGP